MKTLCKNLIKIEFSPKITISNISGNIGLGSLIIIFGLPILFVILLLLLCICIF